MPNHFYPSIGRCIYCGQRNVPLTDEHIIPFAFAGNLVFEEASCVPCARIINKQIETPVLKQEWGAFRAKHKLPTASPKKRPTHTILRGQNGYSERIPLADHTTPVPLYKFGEARILSGLPFGTDDLRWTMAILSDGKEEAELQRKFPKWDKTHRFVARPDQFARLLAKIAHGYATAEYGINAFMPFTPDIILGKSTDYFHTVGGSWDIAPPVPGGNHLTEISLKFIAPSRALLRVDIRLFSSASTPSYHVVVGLIDLQSAEHRRAFDQHRLDGKIVVVPFTGIQP